MRFSTTTILAATTYLAVSARALPHPAPPPTYNVVDVGGPTDGPTDSASGFEPVKTTLPVPTTHTEVSPAATTTTTPKQVVTVDATTTTASSPQWTVVIANVPTSTSSSSASITLSSSSTSSSTSSAPTNITSSTSVWTPEHTETATRTADDGFYHPPGDNGLYRPHQPAVATSATTTAYYGGAAAATGWAQPWNATNSYVKRGFAAPSGRLPSPNAVKHLEVDRTCTQKTMDRPPGAGSQTMAEVRSWGFRTVEEHKRGSLSKIDMGVWEADEK